MIGFVVSLVCLVLSQVANHSNVDTDVDVTNFRDIKPHQVVSVSPSDSFNPTIAVLSAGLLLLVGVAWVLWYRYRRSPDPNSLAMAEIGQLESAYRSNPLHACGQLSNLVRQRISQDIGVEVLSQTTDEVLSSLQSSNSPATLVSQIGKLLTLADQLKFAGPVETGEIADADVFDLTRSILHACESRPVGQEKVTQ